MTDDYSGDRRMSAIAAKRGALVLALSLLCAQPAFAVPTPTAEAETPAELYTREGYTFGSTTGTITFGTPASTGACLVNPAGSVVVVVPLSINISSIGAFTTTVFRNQTISGGTAATVGNLDGLSNAAAGTVLSGASSAITATGGFQIATVYTTGNSTYNPIDNPGEVGLQPGQNACYSMASQGGVGTTTGAITLKWMERPIGAGGPP